jgi:hypothetical protein
MCCLVKHTDNFTVTSVFTHCPLSDLKRGPPLVCVLMKLFLVPLHVRFAPVVLNLNCKR